MSGDVLFSEKIDTWVYRSHSYRIYTNLTCLDNYKRTSKMEDENAAASDNLVTEFTTYEDFLDSQITPIDLYFLEVSFFSSLIY